jgi:hypothetical protein
MDVRHLSILRIVAAIVADIRRKCNIRRKSCGEYGPHSPQNGILGC